MRPAVAIIANPAAGHRQPAWREPVERILSALGRVDVISPDSAEATTHAARDCEDRGVPLVVAAGGDGTAHRVVNGLRATATRVAVLPVGAGNDLAGAIGMPSSPTDAARAMLDAPARDLDVILVNGRRVLTSALFGAIADSAHLANRLKQRLPWLGAFAYRVAAAGMIVTHGSDPVAGVFVANMARLGGDLRLPSGSIPDDGVCEMATLGGGSRVALARVLLRLSRGRPLPVGTLVWRPVRETSLAFPSEVSSSGDGEDLGGGRVFQVEICPKAVRMLVPALA